MKIHENFILLQLSQRNKLLSIIEYNRIEMGDDSMQ